MKLNLCGHEGNARRITGAKAKIFNINLCSIATKLCFNFISFTKIKKVPLSNTSTKRWNKYFGEEYVEQKQPFSGQSL